MSGKDKKVMEGLDDKNIFNKADSADTYADIGSKAVSYVGLGNIAKDPYGSKLPEVGTEQSRKLFMQSHALPALIREARDEISS